MSNTRARLTLTSLTTSLLLLASAHAQQYEGHGNLILDGIPKLDPALSAKLDPYLRTRSARFLDWLPEGGLLISTRFGDSDQVHRVVTPLGMREQLTFEAEPIDAAYVPQIANAQDFLFLENSQIYEYREPDRATTLLSDGKSRYEGLLWSHDGKHYAFRSNTRNGLTDDIYVAEAGPHPAPKLIYAAQQGSWYPLAWSGDDQKLLLEHTSMGQSELFILDAWSGIAKPLDEHGPIREIRAARFSPDNRGVLVAWDEDDEYPQLRYVDPVTHESKRLVPAQPGGIDSFDMSPDGRFLAYVRNEDGESHLHALDTQTHLDLEPPGASLTRIEAPHFDRAGRRLAFCGESARSPRDVYVYDLEHHALERWTRSETGPLDSAGFVAPERVPFPGWDRAEGGRRALHAWVYRPSTPGAHPVLIEIHGGAASRRAPGFEPFNQFLVKELGFAIVIPEMRGSGAYGESVTRADAQELSGASIKDFGSLLVWMGVQNVFDRDRVFVLGDAGGGSLALAALATYHERLHGAVIVASGVEEIAPPLRNLAAIRAPLLVVQGGKHLVEMLRGRGNQVGYLAGAGAQGRPYFAALAEFLSRVAMSRPPS